MARVALVTGGSRGIGAAISKGLKAAGYKAHAEQLWVDEDWHMAVTDGTGLILFVIQVSAMKSAATASLDHRNE